MNLLWFIVAIYFLVDLNGINANPYRGVYRPKWNGRQCGSQDTVDVGRGKGSCNTDCDCPRCAPFCSKYGYCQSNKRMGQKKCTIDYNQEYHGGKTGGLPSRLGPFGKTGTGLGSKFIPDVSVDVTKIANPDTWKKHYGDGFTKWSPGEV